MDPQTQNDIAKLSDADRKELTQFLENEAQRSNIQQSRLGQGEESCAQNCVERWMDTNFAVLKHLETLRGQ
ncbi:mitochondrial import inner membrane translocase subunit tim8 [Aspergillus pseudoviridinutans]|uniref:Mitochondrial import inner membrane translocase subunit n=3 Tax=Aspergillus subgen. Fumigati TaxID=2720872 RepID=A0A9P3BW17_ASPVI|nr:Tim10/DDP family zinc finger protein [Aspergillus fischeri NRRL 181]XP_043123743.1 mitochondrial import inner membrane translocase subunit tim8 [Aspergillus viridinutans]XP_043156200.1 mitochondrial import inner membrane translocase subunit tim8 [Aspergillus pseudoviridinutans]EAW24170.1 Tim10/DDP family zinc finger protein [Aspergillus fischeri NRRL 181]GIJ85453.1 mitochondrial import inner membrane translocase subunit tim8 [Aspergillus pseudoviridinutans]GIK00557.1 mitochondrial import in